MPITYDITKDGFYIRGSKEGEALGEARGEDKTIRAFVLNNKQKGRTMKETADNLGLPIEKVAQYWFEA